MNRKGLGDRLRSGRTEARLHLLAVRRVHLKIDRELRHAGRELPVRALTGSGVIPLIFSRRVSNNIYNLK